MRMQWCPFCEIVAGRAEAAVVLETEGAYAFLDAEPAAPYHTLVIPKRHVRDIFEATEQDLLAVTAAVKRVVDLYRDRLGLEAVEIASNSGAGAQQGVPHLHYHVVPRRQGDGQDTYWRTTPASVESRRSLVERLRVR